MGFNSVIFIFIFLPSLIFLYSIIEQRYKKYLLIFYSLFFYFWGGMQSFKILVAIIIVNYLFLVIQKLYKKQLIVGLAIISNIAVLAYYKYFSYMIDTMNSYFQSNIAIEEIIAPLGISFIIFHAISFQVDIYKNNQLTKTSIADFILYLTFFPKVIQGPIVKFKDFYKQIDSAKITLSSFTSGLELFIIGLTKKIIIADVLGEVVVTQISYLKYYGIDQFTAWIVMFCYFFQIYFDFSGYSDMAIGISKIFGFNFEKNFDFPYISSSITEFWRRWHISLGSWFREYVYIPLGGNRKGNVYFHLLTVFALTGIWHGAGIMYLLWGLLHGVVMLFERWLMKKGYFNRIPKSIRWFYTMTIVAFGWLIFLMPNGELFKDFMAVMLGRLQFSYIPFTYVYILNGKVIFTLMISIIGAFFFCNSYLKQKVAKLNQNSMWFCTVKYGVLIGLFVISLINIISGSYSPFIYFQF